VLRAEGRRKEGSSSAEIFTPHRDLLPSGLLRAAQRGVLSSLLLGILSSANPNIKPEKSDSYTLGLILEPIRHFSASIDAYAIKKNNVIQPPNSSAALAPISQDYRCHPAQPSRPSARPRESDRAGPSCRARGVYVNQSALQTDGVDIDLRGDVEFGDYGKLVSDFP